MNMNYDIYFIYLLYIFYIKYIIVSLFKNCAKHIKPAYENVINTYFSAILQNDFNILIDLL
jgi:hypothetical protein